MKEDEVTEAAPVLPPQPPLDPLVKIEEERLAAQVRKDLEERDALRARKAAEGNP